MISIRELQHIRKEHCNHPIKDDIISLDAMPVRIKENTEIKLVVSIGRI